MKLKKIFLPAMFPLLVAAAVLGWKFRAELFPEKKTEIVLYGNVDDRQVKAAFQIAERIASVKVEEGDVVKQGELLATLETVRIANTLRAAESARDNARANLEKLVNGTREEDISIARAQVDVVQAKLKAAESDFARQTELVKVAAVSHRDSDVAEAECMTYRALLKAAEEDLRKLINGSRAEDIASARAQLAQAEAQVLIEQQKLKDCQLFAPCDAIVRNRLLEPGEMATPQIPVLVLAVITPKWVRTYLPENYLTRIRNGDKAIVRFDGAPGEDFPGWVGFVSPNAEFTPKNVETPEIRSSLVYEMRVFVNDPENRLKLGGPATVVFPENPRP